MKHVITSFGVLSLMTLLAACGSIGQPNIDGKTEVQPKILASQTNQPNVTDSASASPVSLVMYESISCESEWNQYCDTHNTIKLEAPANWQICKPLYSVVSKEGDTNVHFWATSWYPDDTQRPRRFRAYTLRVWSNGSGAPTNKWGSQVQLKDIGISIIPGEADNAARRKAGCELPYDLYKSVDE